MADEHTLGTHAVDYPFVNSRDAEFGTIGIASLAGNNYYVMVVKGTDNYKKSLLVFSDDKLRLSDRHADMIVLKDCKVAAYFTKETAVFVSDVGAIDDFHIVGGRGALVVEYGDGLWYVDVLDGSIEDAFNKKSPRTADWGLVNKDLDGKYRTIFKHTLTTTVAN